MTTRQISTAMKTEIDERTVSRSKELLRFTTSTDIRVDRMNNVEYLGDYDRDPKDDGTHFCIGKVGKETMSATVKSCACELLVTFWHRERNHTRRALIDAQSNYWLEIKDRAAVMGPNCKYFTALDQIWSARMH